MNRRVQKRGLVFSALVLSVLAPGCAKFSISPAQIQSQVAQWSGVYNPSSQAVEWRQATGVPSKNRLIAVPYTGVYNPATKAVEWKSAGQFPTKTDISICPYTGVYNPNSSQVEWREAQVSPASGDGGSAVVLKYSGAYHPNQKAVIWYLDQMAQNGSKALALPVSLYYSPKLGDMDVKTAIEVEASNGVLALPFTGVLNADSGEVEWREAEEAQSPKNTSAPYALPYSGVYNAKTKAVEWKLAEDDSDSSDIVVLGYAGVYNEAQGMVEWKRDGEGFTRDGFRVALPFTGVYNASKGAVEWREASTL